MAPKKPRISIVAAIGKNREIGNGNKLLWHIPDDLKRFKALTLGHPVIMGRKTFESIVDMLGKPLAARTNIVVSRDPEWKFGSDGVRVARSLGEAIEEARALDSEEIFIIGGAQVWEQALPHVDRLYLTLIDDEKEGDAHFPAYESLFTKMIRHEHGDYEGLQYRWVDLEK
jgi:dihydrofolate reductase